MTVYSELLFYTVNPDGVFATTVGGFANWTGASAPDGNATIFETETGVEGQTLDDGTGGGETATADVWTPGGTSDNANVEAELSWTLRDTVTGEVFEVVQFDVTTGGGAGLYTLSEIPLVAGRSYETLAYHSDPDANAGDPVFSYLEYDYDAYSVYSVTAPSGVGTVDGTSGNDLIDGTFNDLEADIVANSPDTVIAGAGNDTILSASGGDVIRAGSGNDSVNGGNGNDTIFAGTGDDTIVMTGANSGDDTIDGGDGYDVLDVSGTSGGNSFNVSFSNIEELRGSNSGDSWFWGSSQITFIGGTGNDTINAGSVSDSLFGGDGNDSLLGGAGNDTLDGGFGDDTVDGGIGNDTILSNLSDATGDTYIGGADSDTFDIQNTITNVFGYTINLETGVGSYGNTYTGFERIIGGNAADTFVAGSVLNVTLEGYGGADSLVGGSGADSLDGGADNDTLIGGDGDDSIAGGGGADFLKSGAGQDTLDGGDGADTLMNAAGDDSLVGGAGDDLIVATQGNDTLEGGDGFDTLMGGVDNDSLDGGADSDLLLGDLAGVAFNATGTDGVGSASNITDFPTTALTFELTLASTDITGDTALGSYAVASEDNEFSVQLQGGGQIAVFVGGAFVGTGIPAATLLDGNINTLSVSWDSATGALEVYVNGANLYSGTTSTGDTLGQGGTFVLGQDQDTLGGGFDVGQAFEGTIYGVRLYDDVRTPAEIADTVAAPVADTTDPNLIANWVADPNSATFTDQTGSHTMAMSGDVTATWSAGDDTILGGIGLDTIYAGGGNDTIDAGSGSDTIFAGDGNDTIDANEGDDSVDAGAGDDLLLAGFGTDTFGGGDGNDTLQIGGTAVDGVAFDVNLNTGLDQYGNQYSGIENVIGGSADDTLTGNAQDNRLEGGGGADSIVATLGGTDYVDGGTGADFISGGDASGSDTLLGGTGNDTIEYLRLFGRIDGGIGDDRIVNFWGTDSGNAGNDIDGGDGIDTFVLDGARGSFLSSHHVNLSTQELLFSGGNRGDLLNFENIEIIDAAAQATGDAGDNLITAIGNFTNTLDGGAGNDTISAGGGNDLLDGGDGNDSIDAGTGNDTIVFTGATAGNDTVDGGDGYDVLDATGSSGTGSFGVTFSNIEEIRGSNVGDSWSWTTDPITFIGGTGTDTVNAGSGNDTIDGGDGADSIDAGAGDDLVDHATGGDTVFGGAGNDTLYGGFSAGVDDAVLHGGEGNDTIVTYGANDTVFGDAGDDFINADGGDESLDGGSGNDTILGKSGNDTIVGGSGSDSIEGGAGNDHITVGNPEPPAPTGTLVSDGEVEIGTTGGDAYVWNTDGGSPSNIILGDGTGGSNSGDGAADTVYVADTDDGGTLQVLQFDLGMDQIVLPEAPTSYVNTFTNNGASYFDVTYANGNTQTFQIFHTGGTTADETLFFKVASPSTNGSTVDGGTGNDTILGGTGDDTLSGGDGDDSIEGGDGDDLLTTGLGNDTLIGGEGNDTLMNSAGDDSLDGGAGDDSIVATDGNDTLRGGTGADTMEGGNDADTFIIEDNFGNDSITGGEGTSGAGPDDDVIDLSAMTGPVTVTYTGDEAGTITDGTDTITFSEIERLILTDQADVVDGTFDSAGLNIDAGGGNDSIVGGAGDDTLDSGAGDDSITGGGGDDTFIFNVGDGADTITDFNTGNSGALGDGDTTNNDFIDLSAYYTDLTELRADFDDDGVLNQSTGDFSDNTTMSGGDSLTFSGANRSSFTADNTNVVCFAQGTMILTPSGELPVESLRPGDLVVTKDNGPQPLVMSARRALSHKDLIENPKLRPIELRPGLFGLDQPLVVSPQHAILARHGGDDVLVRARHLAQLQGGLAREMRGIRRVIYWHLVFEGHQIVFSNGHLTESLFPGPFAIAGMSDPARQEFFLLFPDFATSSGTPGRMWKQARSILPRRSLPPHQKDLCATQSHWV